MWRPKEELFLCHRPEEEEEEEGAACRSLRRASRQRGQPTGTSSAAWAVKERGVTARAGTPESGDCCAPEGRWAWARAGGSTVWEAAAAPPAAAAPRHREPRRGEGQGEREALRPPTPPPLGQGGCTMPRRSTALHLVAGGVISGFCDHKLKISGAIMKPSKCGGTAGAILTCPLEVVKTRLQSSSWALKPFCLPAVQLQGLNGTLIRPELRSAGVLRLLRTMLEKEGVRSLFRGLGPNLIGVAPSRAIYFAAYSGAKEKFNTIFVPESKKVHMLSAACAGVTSSTLTSPIWVVKTRMQLEARAKGEKRTSGLQCAMRIYYTEGLRGFYRGITASYAGVSETIIHFVIYEALKQRLREHEPFLAPSFPLSPSTVDFCGLMAAAAISKTCASCIAYPHEVIRTRLREEGCRYRSFLQTFQLVVREEGPAALYRGLLPHLIRQIPNAAIVMVTYELIIHLATKM